MAWITKLNSAFSPEVRQRGKNYHRDGMVERLRGDATKVSARIFGNDLYDIAVEYAAKDDRVKVSCTCPFVSEYGEPCKHIYAVLLKAQEKELLSALENVPKPWLYLEGADSEIEPDGFDDEEEGDVPEKLVAPPSPDSEKGQELLKKLREMLRPGAKIAPLSELLSAKKKIKTKPTPPPNPWMKHLDEVRHGMRTAGEKSGSEVWPASRAIYYVVNIEESLSGNGLCVEVRTRDRRADGQWGKYALRQIPREALEHLPDVADRQLLALLSGGRDDGYYSYSSYGKLADRYTLVRSMEKLVVELACKSGRAMAVRNSDEEPWPLAWDGERAWELLLNGARDKKTANLHLTGSLKRGDETMELGRARLVCGSGLIFYDHKVGLLESPDAFAWIPVLGREKKIVIPADQSEKMLESLLDMPRLPKLDLPEDLRFERVSVAPRPRLKIRSPRDKERTDKLIGEFEFDYGGTVIPWGHARPGIYDAKARKLVTRDEAAELQAGQLLHAAGFREPRGYWGDPFGPNAFLLSSRLLPKAVRTLTAAGWHVEAEGKLYRQPGKFKMEVSSGVDWFELHGSFDFGGQSVTLPQLLAALRKGERFVMLGDGSFGMLPEEWLKKYAMLTALGQVEEDHLRFKSTQVGMLDALLAAMPEASCDAQFQAARQRLHGFAGVQSAQPPAGFIGELRPYQRDGLGWLHFLRDFRFGGCLADDMGLGKTVQVLALLESRRQLRQAGEKGGEEGGGGEQIPASLVVVPRSLIFNWKQEAARFTPNLRILDHTGQERVKGATTHFNDYDLVLTTYGTLRRDAAHFKDARFDYVILDEAQAVKNSNTDSAKAVRLLQADHRLALSGTPIENHLGELWSLFEFLNPGMLGTARAFNLGSADGDDLEGRKLLATALRPFILRRTKGQVATDLPAKTEQTILCDLPAAQRKKYDELRAYYRSSLLQRVTTQGINHSKIQILEALLRLRQAACHPGLIDKKLAAEPSAKLDALLPQITEVLEEDHKVLVFSQFTSFLAILRDRLDAQGVVYEYLDGQTHDRQARVERFQNDPECKLFLISLKAGGLGLNLTAAEYVFLLDPWWNPAVEAQAIDRAHRIGQTRPVFAYRLIARDTVEEKVLQLQQTKRNLADAIITADNSLIRDLKREDLELLLS